MAVQTFDQKHVLRVRVKVVDVAVDDVVARPAVVSVPLVTLVLKHIPLPVMTVGVEVLLLEQWLWHQLKIVLYHLMCIYLSYNFSEKYYKLRQIKKRLLLIKKDIIAILNYEF